MNLKEAKVHQRGQRSAQTIRAKQKKFLALIFALPILAIVVATNINAIEINDLPSKSGGTTHVTKKGATHISPKSGVHTGVTTLTNLTDENIGHISPKTGGTTINVTKKDATYISPDASVGNFATSPWFSIITGLASVAGLILALYPVQIRGLPPSIFRSLLWQKILLISFGCGLTVLGGIQFYRQENPPVIPFLAHLQSILRGFSYGEQYIINGPLIWVLILFLGVVLFVCGSASNPAKKVSDLVIEEIDRIGKEQSRHLKWMYDKKKYDDLTDTEKELYDQVVQSYSLLQSRVIDMYCGGTPQDNVHYNYSIIALQVEELRRKMSVLLRKSRRTREE